MKNIWKILSGFLFLIVLFLPLISFFLNTQYGISWGVIISAVISPVLLLVAPAFVWFAKSFIGEAIKNEFTSAQIEQKSALDEKLQKFCSDLRKDESELIANRGFQLQCKAEWVRLLAEKSMDSFIFLYQIFSDFLYDDKILEQIMILRGENLQENNKDRIREITKNWILFDIENFKKSFPDIMKKSFFASRVLINCLECYVVIVEYYTARVSALRKGTWYDPEKLWLKLRFGQIKKDFPSVKFNINSPTLENDFYNTIEEIIHVASENIDAWMDHGGIFPGRFT